AEDGIRDLYVTGVQTCALPICRGEKKWIFPFRQFEVERRIECDVGLLLERENPFLFAAADTGPHLKCRKRRVAAEIVVTHHSARSEERRVGKESSARWWGELWR